MNNENETGEIETTHAPEAEPAPVPEVPEAEPAPVPEVPEVPEAEPEGLTHKRGPAVHKRRGVACMPDSWPEGAGVIWQGTIAERADLATCETCWEASGRKRPARDQSAKSEPSPAAPPTQPSPAKTAPVHKPAAVVPPEVAKRMAKAIAPPITLALARGVSWLAKADWEMVKRDLGATNPMSLDGEFAMAADALATYIELNGGAIPPWMVPILAAMPLGMGIAARAGTAKKGKEDAGADVG